MSEPIEDSADGCRIALHVAPRASRTAVAGVYDDRLKLQITAPPVDGAANAAIVKFLAKALGVARSDVEIAAGQTGKRKTVTVRGVSASKARALLGLVGSPA